MTRWRIWLLPALLAVAQLLLWPGLAIARGNAPDPLRTTTALALVVLLAGALGFRRRAPVVVVAVTAAGVGLSGWAVPDQGFLEAGDALSVISVADLVALYSVAVLRSRRTTGLVLAALTGWQSLMLAVQGRAAGDLLLEIGAAVLTGVVVAAAGRVRRRWVADRSAAARRLAEAETARLEAAAAERRRLARELHDVTAHHLTSIVVNASAAQFLGDQRPDLRAEALAYAARTGREALTDLHRLVALLPFGAAPGDPPPPSLADLADDFRQLGQAVGAEVTGDPPAEVAATMHGIAREALTNTLRYAPGSAVRLRFSYGGDGADLVIEDDGAGTGAAGAAGLGGGRGLTGMRERATALGGTVSAGPREDARGWRVHAVLPPAPDRGGAERRRWWHSDRVLDAGLMTLTLLVPVTGVVAAVEEDELRPGAAAIATVALLAHGLPLLWRRNRPWAVLLAVALTGWLGPLLVVAGAIPAESGWLFAFGAGSDLAAVYAVAARGRRPSLTWLAPVGSLASTASALALLVAAAPPTPGEPEPKGPAMLLVLVGFVTVLVMIALAVPFGAGWLAGHATRRRRERRLAREEGAVASAAAQAEWRAREERARVAAGLRDAVLTYAARVPQAADRADLAGVVGYAKESLAAMRGLLDGLNDDDPADRGPDAGRLEQGDPAGVADREREVPSSLSG